MAPKAAKCHIRLIEEADYPQLESIYTAHEGTSLPYGYFDEFCGTIRSEEVIYLVAEVDGRVVGGGGISDYIPGCQANLTFGVVNKDELRKGFGTALLLARLALVHPGTEGCQITLVATEWSVDFFSRLGFNWHDHEQDMAGNIFFHGSHVVLCGDRQVFQRILEMGEVTVAPDLKPADPASHGN